MVEVRVFVIHSEKDNRILQKLFCEYHNRTFGNAKLQIRYVDSQKPSQLGRNFGDIIEEEIVSSRYVIAIVTSNSEKSVWANQEIGYSKGINREILPIKEKSMAEKGLGFIHSNIDAQLFHVRQQRFPKLDGFFEEKLGKKVEKVVKRPVTVKPIGESAKVPTRRTEPDVE